MEKKTQVGIIKTDIPVDSLWRRISHSQYYKLIGSEVELKSQLRVNVEDNRWMDRWFLIVQKNRLLVFLSTTTGGIIQLVQF